MYQNHVFSKQNHPKTALKSSKSFKNHENRPENHLRGKKKRNLRGLMTTRKQGNLRKIMCQQEKKACKKVLKECKIVYIYRRTTESGRKRQAKRTRKLQKGVSERPEIIKNHENPQNRV